MNPPPATSTAHQPPDARTLENWKEHWRDESDAAFLYGILARVEPDAERRAIYLELSHVEGKHAALWAQILADHGVDTSKPPAPSRRARFQGWMARRFGPSLLLSLLLREEGREVKGYLDLYHQSDPGPGRDAAFRLARESAEHAGTLGNLSGAGGEPWHRTESGGFLRNVVYGFNDGLTANFGLVAGILGADVQPHIVMVTGFAGMIADALSMGASGYLAAKSEREVYEHEIAMEAEEIRMMPELEEEELALIYRAKGIAESEAKSLARDVMRDPDRALREKVREELQIGEARTTPFREGWITGVATAVGAFIPVAPFLFLHGAWAVWVAFAAAMISHFAVGAARSLFTGRGIFRSGIDMFVVGLGVAAVGYLFGDLITKGINR